MNKPNFICVAKDRDMEHKWIENTPAAKRAAVKEGFIYQSIFEYEFIPDGTHPSPPCAGDFWIIAESRVDPLLGLSAVRVLLDRIAYFHPELDLDMLHYYAEYNEYHTQKKFLVRIPAVLFGGASPCVRQPLYHFKMMDKFINYTNPEYPIFSHLPSLVNVADSIDLKITDIISPYLHLSGKPALWLPPENSTNRCSRYIPYTVELSRESFMENDIDQIGRDAQFRKEWRIQTRRPEGAPLEDIYLKAQFVPVEAEKINRNQASLELCPVYQAITKSPETLDKRQIDVAIGLFAPLGKAGLRKAQELFEGKHDLSKDQIRVIFLTYAYNRVHLHCAEIHDFFDCPQDCCVQNPYQLEARQKADSEIRDKYRVYSDGVYYSATGFSEEDATPVKICSRFEVIALIRNASGNLGWGKRVLIHAPDGSLNPIDIRMKDCQGGNLIGILADNGLQYADNHARKHITEYFNACKPKEIIELTDRLGWHDKTFVFPEGNIGFSTRKIEYNEDFDKFQISGTLTDWQENVGQFCKGNSLLMLLIASAFTGPLLRPLNLEGGGFHLFGSSSLGKTTQAQVTGSVWGGNKNNGYLTPWRATANGLEKVASSHNDGFLILDEIGEASADDVSQVSYMLVNGQGKIRMSKDASLKRANSWRLNFLSTGELPLAEKIAESAKRRVMAGQEVRMVDLPVTACGEYGAFEDLHGCKSGAEFSNLLKANAARYYGAPIRVFLQELCGESLEAMERNIGEIDAMRKAFIHTHCPANSSGQVQRVTSRFALIAAVGAFACQRSILPWSESEGEAVAVKWFNIWLKERGTLGSKEVESAIRNLKEHWELNWKTRYIDKSSGEYNWLGDRLAGYREVDKKSGRTICHMLPETFTQLTKDCNRRELLAELEKRDMLFYNSKGKPNEFLHPYGESVRVYSMFLSRENEAKDEDEKESLSRHGNHLEDNLF